MPIFEYVAKDKAGKIHRGSAEATDEKALIKQLDNEGYWVTQASLSAAGDANASLLVSGNPKAESPDAADVEKAKLIYIAMGLLMLAIALFVFLR